MFAGKKVVLGISGGIAAYKAADVVSWLTKNHAEVHVVMTKHATEFITPLVMQTLSGRPVAVDEFATGFGWQVVHISLVERADLVAVIPATANVLAKIAHGIADDVLTSAILAATCPILLAPAMNVHMYENVATQTNLARLQEMGYELLEPASGRLACGTEGKGRLPDLAVMQEKLTALLLPKQDLVGKKVLVTAGPTQEPIDPVRYLTNRSSGKMGYAIAKAAAARGAQVVLVSGPVVLPAPPNVRLVSVRTAEEMKEAVLAEYEQMDIVIKAAAVADYRVINPSTTKIKKTTQNEQMTLHLERNPDILKLLGRQKKTSDFGGVCCRDRSFIGICCQKITRKKFGFDCGE